MTELVFILDRSGSMSGLEADTIGGFNSMLAQQKREAGEALVSTVFFANDSTVIHDRLPLSEVPPLTEKEYFTCGCTALLDAVGGAEGEIRLGVFVPRRKHRRGQGGGTFRHRCGPLGELQVRRGGHSTQLRGHQRGGVQRPRRQTSQC